MGDEPQDYYEVRITLVGYTYASSAAEAAGLAAHMYEYGEEHLQEMSVLKVYEPEEAEK